MTMLVITLFNDMPVFFPWIATVVTVTVTVKVTVTLVDFGLTFNLALQLLRMCSEYNNLRYAVTVVTLTVTLTVTVTVTVTVFLLVFTFNLALLWPSWGVH